MKKLLLPSITIAVAVMLSSCDKEPVSTVRQDFVNTYADIAFASYNDALTEAQTFRTMAQDFVTAPTALKYTNLKQQYIDMRYPYEQTEAYRFYGGPIDNETDGPEGLLNAWPMDESYVDYVVGNPTAGIINNVAGYPTIDMALLESLNEVGGETNISCGYHAIEFLLWGQDVSAVGPGDRPYTDYVVGGTAAEQTRRGQYLLAVTDLLISHLEMVNDAWDPAVAGNYRSTFVSNVDQSIELLLTGMGKWSKGELAGERMTTALNNQSQEDEHSCFSDQTHNDLVWGNKSFVNLWLGTYTKSNGTEINGTGVIDMVIDETLKTTMQAEVDLAIAKLAAIQPPFDQEILGSNPAGNARVQDAINALRNQADRLVEVASHLGYNIVL